MPLVTLIDDFKEAKSETRDSVAAAILVLASELEALRRTAPELFGHELNLALKDLLATATPHLTAQVDVTTNEPVSADVTLFKGDPDV